MKCTANVHLLMLHRYPLEFIDLVSGGRRVGIVGVEMVVEGWHGNVDGVSAMGKCGIPNQVEALPDDQGQGGVDDDRLMHINDVRGGEVILLVVGMWCRLLLLFATGCLALELTVDPVTSEGGIW